MKPWFYFFQFRFSDERSGTRGEGGIWGTEKESKNVHMVRRLKKKEERFSGMF